MQTSSHPRGSRRGKRYTSSGTLSVATGVADRVPERLAHLVYVDAALPHDGESALDAYPREGQAALRDRVRTLGEGWYQPVRDEPQWGITDLDD